MKKIRVDPKTFKIINQEKLSDLKSDSQSFTSDSDSSTSLHSESESDSIKVIKLDNSEQSGGKNYDYKKFQQKQPIQQPIQQPPRQLLNQAISISESTVSEPKRNVENYLRNNIENKNFEETNTSELDLTESTEATEIKEQIPEQTQNLKFEEKNSADIIDLTKSQLHDVLHSIFTDVAGDSISENIGKMSKLFETHNQIMEKILNQLIIINSNYKQITVPEAIQTNTKQAPNINDFRKNIQKIE